MYPTIDEARQILVAKGGNVTKAAQSVGMTRHSWARRYGDLGVRRGKRPAFTRHERTVVFADVHAPYHDAEAFAVALEYAKELKPRRVVLLGDFFDCYAVSHWKKDPRRKAFSREVEDARAVLEQISMAFIGADLVYIEGNHEIRLRDYLWTRSPELDGLPCLTVQELLGLDELGWRWISNQERLNADLPPYALGKLYLLHGHEVRVSANSVNIPRLYWQRCHANVLVAHHHQAQEHIVKRIDHKHCGAWSAGCLCKLSAEYMPVTNWVHGLVVIDHDPFTGRFSVANKKIIEGKVR